MMTRVERDEFHRRMEAQNEADRAEFRRRKDASSTSSFHPGSDSQRAFRDDFGAEERARRQWEADPELRAEFGELERYIAFIKADAKGLVKIFGRK